ncbi:hypothetical protein ACWDTI_05475 [Gordonia sp. NPDC003424]
MNTHTPRDAVTALRAHPSLPGGSDERFTGYGVMGLPFSSGHLLAMRDMVASSVGPPYRTIWHRDPEGRWTIHTTTEPGRSCPRYFGAATSVRRVERIDVTWVGDREFDVSLGDEIRWHIALTASPATAMMSAVGASMPTGAWTSDPVLAAMGPMARMMLGAGRIRLHGRTPNGNGFKAAPLAVWRVADSAATVGGVDAGRPAALPTQSHLGDFWLPQRGLFFIGNARFGAPVDERAQVTSTAHR